MGIMEDVKMLTYEDCVGLCGLTVEEVEAIAEHDHIPNIVATELGAYLVNTEGGLQKIRRIILDDIEHAREREDIKHTAKLKSVLKHFVDNHPELSQIS